MYIFGAIRLGIMWTMKMARGIENICIERERVLAEISSMVDFHHDLKFPDLKFPDLTSCIP